MDNHVTTKRTQEYASQDIVDILESLSIAERLRGLSAVLVKPNYCHPKSPETGATTHPETVRGVLEYLRGFPHLHVLVGDGIAQTKRYQYPSTQPAYEVCGLLEVLRDYPEVELVDLYLDRKETIPLAQGTHFSSLNISQVAMGSGIINLAKMKGHHRVGMTASMKNLFGCLENKQMLHGDNDGAFLDRNVLDLYLTMRDRIVCNIVDGIIGIENRPYDGIVRRYGVIIGGVSAPQVDKAVAEFMHIPLPPYVADALALERPL